MPGDVEHLFKCLLVFCISCFENWFEVLCPILHWIGLFHCSVLWVADIFCILILCWIGSTRILFPILLDVPWLYWWITSEFDLVPFVWFTFVACVLSKSSYTPVSWSVSHTFFYQRNNCFHYFKKNYKLNYNLYIISIKTPFIVFLFT